MRFCLLFILSCLINYLLLHIYHPVDYQPPKLQSLSEGEICFEFTDTSSSPPAPKQSPAAPVVKQPERLAQLPEPVPIQRNPKVKKKPVMKKPKTPEPIPAPTPLTDGQASIETLSAPPAPVTPPKEKPTSKPEKVPPPKPVQKAELPPKPPAPKPPKSNIPKQKKPVGVKTRARRLLTGPLRPNYPEEARRRGIQGEVDLHIWISDKGRVTQVEIRKSSGYRILDEEAVRFARTLRYEPARLNGKPVPAEELRLIRFTLR